jgi:hypothetical protein
MAASLMAGIDVGLIEVDPRFAQNVVEFVGGTKQVPVELFPLLRKVYLVADQVDQPQYPRQRTSDLVSTCECVIDKLLVLVYDNLRPVFDQQVQIVVDLTKLFR